MMPSSSTKARPSSPTRSRTRRSWRSAIRRERSSGPTDTPSSREPRSGYLHEPDDAYLLKNGQITVADAQNCRVLVLNADGTVADQIGTNGVCVHNPPKSMGSPNGDTPLADGNLLVSEINGSWVTEYTPHGNVVWTVHLPISLPLGSRSRSGPTCTSSPTTRLPGQVLEFTRSRTDRLPLRRHHRSGHARSSVIGRALAERGRSWRTTTTGTGWWPSTPRPERSCGSTAINDQAGTTPGMLNTPDGFDLLLPDGSTPTHLATG